MIFYRRKKIIIGLIAGEESGDLLGANLIKSLKKKIPNIYCIGVSGPLMQKEGCKKLYSIKEFNTMGIFEIIKKIPKLLIIRRKLIKYFIKLKVDLFIGIDFPDFNLSIEKKLKKKGIKTVHYVSPSIWAWRKKRIFKIKKSTNLILILFYFEKKIYDHYNITYSFVGHFAADNIPLNPKKNKIKKKLNIKNKKKYLVILPGSRLSEIKMLSKDFLKTAIILKKKNPNLKILVSLTNNKKCIKEFIKIYKKVKKKIALKILFGKTKETIIIANVALAASGTVTLECMLAKCPMVVAYKVNKLTYYFFKHFIKIPFISLPNLLIGKKIVQEFIQNQCTPKNLSKSIQSLLFKKKKIKKIKKIFLKTHKNIQINSSKKISKSILNLIKKNFKI